MRTTSSRYQVPLYMEYRDAADQLMYTLYKRPSAVYGDYISKSDVTRNVAVASWRSPSAYSADVLAGAPWTGIVKMFHSYQGEYRVYNGNSVEYAVGAVPEPSLVTPAGLIARAEQKLIGKVKGESLQLANDVLEAAQVKTLMSSARHKPLSALKQSVAVLQRVASAYNAVKRGRYKQAARILDIRPKKATQKGVSAQWLEYRYGWLPLLSSISDAYNLARKGIVVRRSFKAQSVLKHDRWYDWGTSLPGSVRVETEQQGSFIVKCRVDYVIDDAEVRRLSAIGMADPATIAWEAVPFSFVVDWAMPLTNVIGAIGASRGLTFVGGTKTEVARFQRTASISLGGKADIYTNAVMASGATSSSWFKMRRSLYASTPLPSVYLRNPFSVTHLLDAMTLIRQLVK